MTSGAAHEASPPPLFTVSPEPSDEELAAITAAVLVVMHDHADASTPMPVRSAWRAAALTEGVAAADQMVTWRRGGLPGRS